MAIHTKKRDRLTMLSSPTSYPRAPCSPSSRPTSASGCASSPPASAASVADEQEEYERAVAFLTEFRSRRVASPALHSTSLDAIVESDGLDEILASDFSLALTVGRGPSMPDLERREERGGSSRRGPSKPGLRRKEARDTSFPTTRPSPVGLSRMKKAATTKCLLDMDAAPSSNDERVARPVTPPTSEPDYYFSWDGESSPAAKRRRSLLAR